jgi:pyruvate dehydrogenase E2 component (dihydrolipoamide acetyltransferase)
MTSAPDPVPPAAAARTLPLPPMQRFAAAHLERSLRESVPVTVHGLADAEALLALRDQLAAARAQGQRITLTHLLAQAVARALRAHEGLNATLAGRDVVLHGAVHLGLATALPDGTLVVPVLRDADRLGIDEIATAAAALSLRARSGRLDHADLSGATFTLSNAGAVPSVRWTTPIIPLGQAAILALGALHEAPVVHRGAVVARRVLPTSLSFDHRFVNGVPAARFLGEVHQAIAEPGRYGVGQ